MEENTESDHQPLMMWLKGEIEKGEKKRRIIRGNWKEEGRRRFKERIGGISRTEGGMDEELKEVGKRIREALEEGGSRGER